MFWGRSRLLTGVARSIWAVPVRALFACLLMHANEVVAAERLMEDLWGAGSAGANPLQVSVSRLRKALVAEDRLLTPPPGYLLRVTAGECDRDLFEQLAGEAGRSSRTEGAGGGGHAGPGTGFVAGPPFVDFLYEPFAQAEIARLEEAWLACLEERVEADLALGRHGELAGELEALTREHPLRERPRGQLMLALYRSGRQADALEVYRDTRELFAADSVSSPARLCAGSRPRSCAKTTSSSSRARRLPRNPVGDAPLRSPAAPAAGRSQAGHRAGDRPRCEQPPLSTRSCGGGLATARLLRSRRCWSATAQRWSGCWTDG